MRFAPPPASRTRTPEHRLASTRELLLPPPPAPSAPVSKQTVQRLPAEPERAPEPAAERQLDARLLDILQPPPVIVEQDDETQPPAEVEASFKVPPVHVEPAAVDSGFEVSPVHVEPEAVGEPVKQASADAPLYPVVDSVPSLPPVTQEETLAPIVAPPKVVRKRR